ncbi:MAG: tRNA threonylcarbamoyladenosine dehydratase [Ruminococcaceae bacterium]|nr:tRNA threonylcarbamoyladenosine dehydratase [Oscillospiraceae bacterium]
MENIFSRTENLIGKDALSALKNSHVAIFGIGGVGGHTAEALIRAGISNIDIIDNDIISPSNINRQILATHSTIGKNKTDVMKQRLSDINPKATINTHNVFFTPENSHTFDFSKYDYIVDAVDTVTAKIELALKAKDAGVDIISCMGTGNKLDPTRFEITDIYKTSVCPLAKVMRYELKRRGIKKLKVLFSKEEPIKNENSSRTPASISFVPAVAGLIIAGEVIKDIIKNAEAR